MTTEEFPVDEWRLLFAALCAGSPAWLGTLGPPEQFQMIYPTRFDWLAHARWRAPRRPGDSGLALLELAAPRTVAAAAWEPLCGTLTEAQVTREGRVLTGRHEVPGTSWSAIVTLYTDWAEDRLVRRVHVRTR